MVEDRLQLDLSSSWLLISLLSVVHVIALFAIWASTIEFGYQLAFSFAVFVSWLVSVRQQLPDQNLFFVTSVTFASNQWHLNLSNAKSIIAELQSPALVLSFLLVLNFKTAGRKFSVVVLPDSASARQAREARIFFKFFQPKVGGTNIVSMG